MCSSYDYDAPISEAGWTTDKYFALSNMLKMCIRDSFTGNHISEEAVCYAVSTDGYTYWALNDNKPVIDSKIISSTGGVRDPHILRCKDGKTFYMVVTDMVSDNGWDSNRAMVLLKSTDLVNWNHSVINMQKRYGTIGIPSIRCV